MALMLVVLPIMLVSCLLHEMKFLTDVDRLAWEFVEVNAGEGVPGFELESDNTLTWNSTEFGGWLGKYPYCHISSRRLMYMIACDWWHGAPQLFWIVYYEEGIIPFPSFCSEVDLIPAAISS